ncbi:MAG: hypothetical protein HY606_13140, partial [Planctomycetes bacterium]|nr:hypothetical protein [Planctomycetota bacterium]
MKPLKFDNKVKYLFSAFMIILTAVFIKITFFGKNPAENIKNISEAEKSTLHKPEITPVKNNENRSPDQELKTANDSEKDPLITRLVKINGRTTDQMGNPIANIIVAATLTQETNQKNWAFSKQDGQFYIELRYPTNLLKKDQLNLEIRNDLSGLPYRDEDEELSNFVMDYYAQGLYKQKFYSAAQQFDLKGKEQTIEAIFVSMSTALLNVKPNPKSIDFYHKGGGHTSYIPVVAVTCDAISTDERIYTGIRSDEGVYQFTVPAGVELKILCTLYNHTIKTEVVAPLAADSENEFIVNLEKGTFKFRGKCSDENGFPVPDVQITAAQEGLNDIIAQTDEKGNFELDVYEKPLTFINFEKYYYFQSKRIENIDISEFLFVALIKIKMTLLNGRCLDEDGNPIQNASISNSKHIGGLHSINFFYLYTDADGNFSMEIPDEWFPIEELYFKSPNHKTVTLKDLSRTFVTTNSPLTIKMIKGKSDDEGDNVID